MRKIIKGPEPYELTTWKHQHPVGRYEDLTHIERQAIKCAAIREQFGLCAYCCKRIDEQNSINEHVQPRNLAPHLQLDFGNIVTSCNTRERCDYSHKAQLLPLTPLMAECEEELEFYLSGKVSGLTQRANNAISILNLDNRAIREERKQMVDNLIFPDHADDLQLLDDELLRVLISDLQEDNNGQLPPYSPILINIIKQILT